MNSRVIEEVRRFAEVRNGIFDDAKARAVSAMRERIDPQELFRDPEAYLKTLFAVVGTRIVKRMMPRAEQAGKDHAERLFKIRNQDA